MILAWNARRLPGDLLPGFIERFLRGEVAPVPELVLPADLLILGCTTERDPSRAPMPARRRFRGDGLRFATGEAMLGRGLAIVILTAERGLVRPWEGGAGDRQLGPTGPAMTPEHAARLAAEGATAGAFLHRILVGTGGEERPPYRHVLVGGSAFHQEVVAAWHLSGVFRGAELIWLPPDNSAQAAALAARYALPLSSRPLPHAPAQLSLL